MAFRVEFSTEAKLDFDAVLSWLIEQAAGESGGFRVIDDVSILNVWHGRQQFTN